MRERERERERERKRGDEESVERKGEAEKGETVGLIGIDTAKD